MQGGQVTWIIDGDKNKFERTLAAASGEARAFGNTLTSVGRRSSTSFTADLSNSFSSISSGLGQLVKGVALVGIAGSAGFGAMGKAAFDQVRQVENATFALRAYEKDGAKVNAVLSELVGYARSDLGVLFKREDLFAAASTLRIYGESTDTLVDKIKILSRGVALGKTTFQELSQIVGRAAAKGRLDAVDFDMLIERGIGLDKSFRGAAVTSESLYKALENALPTEILEGRANSIDGIMIRLQSAFRDLGSSILGVDQNTSKFVEGGLGDRLLKLLVNLRATLASPEIRESFAEFGRQIASFAEKAIPALITGIAFIARNANTLIPIFISLTAAWFAASVAATVLTIAAGPIGLVAFAIAAAIVALVAAVTFLQLKFNILGKTTEFVRNNFNVLKIGFMTTMNAVFPFIGILVMLISTFSRVASAASSMRQQVVNSVVNMKNSAISVFSGAASWLIGGGRAIISGLINGIRSMAGALRAGVATTSAQIGAFFAGAGGWLVGVGRAIIQGLVNGIRSMAGAAASAARGVANDAIQGAKNVLGIKSPSTVFAGIGKNVALGLAGGIEGGASLVKTASDSMTNNLFGGIATPSMATGAGYMGGNNISHTTHIENIYISKEVDGERLIRKLTRDQVVVDNGLTPSRVF